MKGILLIALLSVSATYALSVQQARQMLREEAYARSHGSNKTAAQLQRERLDNSYRSSYQQATRKQTKEDRAIKALQKAYSR